MYSPDDAVAARHLPRANWAKRDVTNAMLTARHRPTESVWVPTTTRSTRGAGRVGVQSTGRSNPVRRRAVIDSPPLRPHTSSPQFPRLLASSPTSSRAVVTSHPYCYQAERNTGHPRSRKQPRRGALVQLQPAPLGRIAMQTKHYGDNP